MKQKITYNILFIAATIFGFYIGFIGIWNQDDTITIPALLFLGLLFILEYNKNQDKE